MDVNQEQHILDMAVVVLESRLKQVNKTIIAVRNLMAVGLIGGPHA